MSEKRKHSSKKKKRSKSRSRSRRSRSRRRRRDRSTSDSDSPYRRGKKSRKRLKYSRSRSKSRCIKIEQICAASLRYRKCNRQTCENLGNFGKRESSYRNVDATTISESWFSGNNALFPFSAFTTNDQRKITFRSNFQVSIDNIFKLATNEQIFQQFEFTKHNVVL